MRQGDEKQVTAKTTGQARIRPSGNVTSKISDLPHGLICRLACSLCWRQKASDQRQQRLQARRESDHVARQRETSDHQQQRLQ